MSNTIFIIDSLVMYNTNYIQETILDMYFYLLLIKLYNKYIIYYIQYVALAL